MSAADKARMRAKERLEKEKARLAGNPGLDGETSILIGNINGAEAKSKKKVTFAEEPIILNASEDGVREKDTSQAHNIAWTDMKKQEHLKEKELLGNAK